MTGAINLHHTRTNSRGIPWHNPLCLAFYEVSPSLKLVRKWSNQGKERNKNIPEISINLGIFCPILLCKCCCSTFALLGVLLIASCVAFAAAASSLLPDSPSAFLSTCASFYSCFLPQESPPSSSSLYISPTFHPIISAVTPPSSISSGLSPPPLNYPLVFFPTSRIYSFTAVLSLSPAINIYIS